ncbi:hypothetical protein YC2023_033387 [Brassica napus]
MFRAKKCVELNLSPKNCAVYSPPIMFSRAFRNGAIGDVVPHGSKVMRFSSLDSFWAEKNK